MPSKLGMVLHDWFGLEQNLALTRVFNELDAFTRLSSCISPGGLMSDELFSRLQKAGLILTDFRQNLVII